MRIYAEQLCFDLTLTVVWAKAEFVWTYPLLKTTFKKERWKIISGWWFCWYASEDEILKQLTLKLHKLI